MKSGRIIQRFAVPVALLGFLPLVGAQDSSFTPTGTTILGISAPSDKRNLPFADVGIVKEMLVKNGDAVKAGQLVATEDSDLEELELASMKIEAESTSQLKADQADRDIKKLQADNLKKALASGGANTTEVEAAQLAYTESEDKIQYDQEQMARKAADVAKQERKIEKMKLTTPIDGIVEKISLQPGEVFDPNKPDGVLTIVKNQPLWVDMHIPSTEAAKLKVGQTLSASYDLGGQAMNGKIIFMDPVVDAASDTQTVRMELPNEEGKPSGLPVNVRLP
jgi:RND family efflux transporter MFP subunit